MACEDGCLVVALGMIMQWWHNGVEVAMGICSVDSHC